MSRRLSRSVFLAVLAALVLGAAACGGGDGGASSEKAKGPVTITFWHGQNQSAGKVIRALVDDFNRTHQDVKVDAQLGAVADSLQA